MAPTITFISSISILVRFIKPVYFLWNKVETYCNGIVMFKPVGSLMCSKGFDTSYHDTGPFSSRGWLVGVIKFGVHICNTLLFVVISSIHTGKLMFLIQHQNNVLCRFYILSCFFIYLWMVEWIFIRFSMANKELFFSHIILFCVI